MTRRGFGRDGPENLTLDPLSNAIGELGAVFTLKPQAKYMTGARTVIKINGKLLGYAFAVSWNCQTDATEIFTIDDPVAWEIAPRRISVSGSLGLFQIPGQSPQADLIQSDLASFLMNRYISIEVKDSATDAILFKTNRAMVTNQQSDLNSEQMGRTVLSWRAVGWQAESPPKPIKTEDMQKNPDSVNPISLAEQLKLT